MSRTRPEPPADVAELLDRLGVALDADLARQAVVHRSWAYENGNPPTNERLEFLGDAVLGIIVTEWLFRTHPDEPEGELAKLRAAVVNSRALADVARELEVGRFLLLGRGEEGSGGRDKSSILADALEALLGAVYLQLGLEPTREVVLRLFADTVGVAEQLGAGLDWKTSLQELAAARGAGIPEYAVEPSGPDHAKTFTAVVTVAGEPAGTGSGRSKKEAEQQAAERAWRALSAGSDG
jgi:ribonuclease-3